MIACKVTAPMVFEETNSGHCVEIILRLIPEISIPLRTGGKFLKEIIVNVYRDRSFNVC